MSGAGRARRLALALALLAVAGDARAGSSGGGVFRVPLADGTAQAVWWAAPAHPRGAIVMLPGGSGEIGLEPDGRFRHGANFVVRTRALWLARGYAVAIPDAIGGRSLRGVRSTPFYAGVVARLVAFARAAGAGPVFLLGTSQGSIAAMNGAAHAAAGAVAGVVLTSSVSVRGGSGETVFDADPGDVRVPGLVVANRDDRCDVAPPGAAPRIAGAMTASPSVRVWTVSGGATRPGEPSCGSGTPHGYDGIEPAVVDGIADWMDRIR